MLLTILDYSGLFWIILTIPDISEVICVILFGLDCQSMIHSLRYILFQINIILETNKHLTKTKYWFKYVLHKTVSYTVQQVSMYQWSKTKSWWTGASGDQGQGPRG